MEKLQRWYRVPPPLDQVSPIVNPLHYQIAHLSKLEDKRWCLAIN